MNDTLTTDSTDEEIRTEIAETIHYSAQAAMDNDDCEQELRFLLGIGTYGRLWSAGTNGSAYTPYLDSDDISRYAFDVSPVEQMAVLATNLRVCYDLVDTDSMVETYRTALAAR